MDMHLQDLVWAKLKNCKYWPAKIVNAPPELGKVPTNKICVLFFGTKNFGFIGCDGGLIVDYAANREKYLNKYKKVMTTDFRDAINQMDDYIRDPITYASNASVKPINNKLTVKQERSATVKTEKELDDNPFVSNAVQFLDSGSQISQLEREKSEMIQELVEMKSDNQKINFELQQKCNEIQVLNEQRMAENMHMSKTIRTLQNELNDWKQKCSIAIKKHDDDQGIISKLKREKNELSAQLIQLRRISQIQHDDSSDTEAGEKETEEKETEEKETEEEEEEEVFEVESLLKHKVNQRKIRSFLVRWKNYSSDHDSWVKESDLNCPTILKEYLKKHSLK